MAEEQMIDITRVKGTGPDGRIVKEDIEKALEEQNKVSVPPEEVARVLYQGRKLKADDSPQGDEESHRREDGGSLSSSAQLSFLGKFDATELVQFRKALLNREKAVGVNITYTEILVYAIARALKDHPDINVSLIENEIKVWEDINIGVAVALGKEGLLVPVVKQADKKSLIEISQEVKRLVEKARGGKILPDEVTGGTFTLTSIGAVGVSDYQTPVINPPESAILGTGPIRDEACGEEWSDRDRLYDAIQSDGRSQGDQWFWSRAVPCKLKGDWSKPRACFYSSRREGGKAWKIGMLSS